MKIARFYITDGTATWSLDAPWSERQDIDANAAMEGFTIYHVTFPQVQDCSEKTAKKPLSPKAARYLQYIT
jgi:hypothetical protein